MTRPRRRPGAGPVRRFPAATVDRPSGEELHEMAMDSVATATDGCDVEPDGECEHGHPSWLVRLGLI